MIISLLQVGTARVVWSFNNHDPSDPLGESAQVHDYQGSRSLTLLGGLISGPPSKPADLQSFDLTLSNVRENISCLPCMHGCQYAQIICRSLFLLLPLPTGVKLSNYLKMSDLQPNTSPGYNIIKMPLTYTSVSYILLSLS